MDFKGFLRIFWGMARVVAEIPMLHHASYPGSARVPCATWPGPKPWRSSKTTCSQCPSCTFKHQNYGKLPLIGDLPIKNS